MKGTLCNLIPGWGDIYSLITLKHEMSYGFSDVPLAHLHSLLHSFLLFHYLARGPGRSREWLTALSRVCDTTVKLDLGEGLEKRLRTGGLWGRKMTQG